MLTPDEKWLLTANQTSDSVTLVRLSDGLAVEEIACGKHPAAIALTPDGRRALVSATYSGQLHILAIDGEHLRAAGSIRLGFEPRGIAVSPDGKLAYVALTAANAVAVVDLDRLEVKARIAVGRWPRYLALTRDGTRLAVGASGDGGISVVDTQTCVKLYDSKFVGLNIGHVQASADGKFAYFPWMVYADRPITSGNIREGWVLGNRVARVRLDGPARREALALDPRGRAVADPHGIALSPDEQWLVMSAGGTHELVVFRLADLPLRSGWSGRPSQTGDCWRQRAVFPHSAGRAPAGPALRSRRRARVCGQLSGQCRPNREPRRSTRRANDRAGRSARNRRWRGAEKRSFTMPCAVPTVGTVAIAATMKETRTRSRWTRRTTARSAPIRWCSACGTARTRALGFGTVETNDFHAALRKSLTDTMQGPAPTDDDVAAVAAFLEAMPSPENSHRQDGGELSGPALRGKKVFESAEAGCAACHRGPYLTDGEIHDVGLGSEHDVYRGFNTPSLLGIGNRVRYLHHGRAESLEDLLTDLHSPAKVSGTRELTSEERADLIAYLRSL